jgi:hypothetical protein
VPGLGHDGTHRARWLRVGTRFPHVSLSDRDAIDPRGAEEDAASFLPRPREGRRDDYGRGFARLRLSVQGLRSWFRPWLRPMRLRTGTRSP